MTMPAELAPSSAVWNDGDSGPLREAPDRQEAERLLLGRPDHDYAYIQSPAGEQYAWNHVRGSWERV
jgi:hypothetical protein